MLSDSTALQGRLSLSMHTDVRSNTQNSEKQCAVRAWAEVVTELTEECTEVKYQVLNKTLILTVLFLLLQFKAVLYRRVPQP